MVKAISRKTGEIPFTPATAMKVTLPKARGVAVASRKSQNRKIKTASEMTVPTLVLLEGIPGSPVSQVVDCCVCVSVCCVISQEFD